MSQIETNFNDLGINAIQGVELLGSLGLTTDDLEFPQVFSKLQSVVKYLSNFPEDTQRFLINKATRGKMVDKLGHMFEYTQILKEKERYEREMESAIQELSALGVNNDFGKVSELEVKKGVIGQRLDMLKEELNSFN